MLVLNQAATKNSQLWNGDAFEIIHAIPDNSVHFSVFSPPFAALFVYSDSDRDAGNCRDMAEFLEHYKFLSKELYRVLMPGRLIAVHCMLLPSFKYKDGFIGLKAFRNDLTRIHEDDGFILHSEVTIKKCPVRQMQRTKALGLLHKQVKKDATRSRQGLADYLVVFRKPGENPEPVTHTAEELPVSLWQIYANTVWDDLENKETVDFYQRFAECIWFDIDESKTLQKESAREERDSKHICPLQLEVIERAIRLWTNPNDIVLTPFAGIGSEVYQAVKMGRRGVGIELKESYYKQACLNVARAEQERGKRTLFDVIDEAIPDSDETVINEDLGAEVYRPENEQCFDDDKDNDLTEEVKAALAPLAEVTQLDLSHIFKGGALPIPTEIKPAIGPRVKIIRSKESLAKGDTKEITEAVKKTVRTKKEKASLPESNLFDNVSIETDTTKEVAEGILTHARNAVNGAYLNMQSHYAKAVDESIARECVLIGQVYQDLDKRANGRQAEVVAVDVRYAQIKNIVSGKISTISLDSLSNPKKFILVDDSKLITPSEENQRDLSMLDMLPDSANEEQEELF